MGDFPDELLLCPVRALQLYLSRTATVSPRPSLSFWSLLVLLLVLSLRMLLASSFAMLFPVLTLPPLLLFLLLVPLLRRLLCRLIVCVGLLLRGLLRVMSLFPLFLLRRRGLPLRSSPPSISLKIQFSSSWF